MKYFSVLWTTLSASDCCEALSREFSPVRCFYSERAISDAFMSIFNFFVFFFFFLYICRLQSNQKILNPDSGNQIKQSSDRKLVDPNFDDMKQMVHIFQKVSMQYEITMCDICDLTM